MKRIYILALFGLTLFSACDKADRDLAPGERPDERLIKTLTDYKNQLVGAQYGWKATLYPAGGAGYSFYFRFADNDRVLMASDINASTAGAPVESTYRLKAVQRPSLLFDTYSHLHILSDPDERKSGGDRGEGKYADFEFSFVSSSPDSIRLTGNMKGSRLVLVRATADEAANFIPRLNTNARALEGINTFTTYFKRLTVGGNTYEVDLDANLRTLTLGYYEGNSRRTFSTGFYYTTEGIMLLEPFQQGGTTFTSFENLQYNASTRRLNLTINNASASIQEAIAPLRINVQAARDFIANATDDYWVTFGGFTVEGVEDVDQLRNISNFTFLLLYPNFGRVGNAVYDLFAYVVNTPTGPALTHRPAAFPTITSDGRLVYTYHQNVGNLPVPPDEEPKIQATIARWTEARGFYVIPIAEGEVDLVSAKDAKTWIHLYK